MHRRTSKRRAEKKETVPLNLAFPLTLKLPNNVPSRYLQQTQKPPLKASSQTKDAKPKQKSKQAQDPKNSKRLGSKKPIKAESYFDSSQELDNRSLGSTGHRSRNNFLSNEKVTSYPLQPVFYQFLEGPFHL